MPSYIDETGIHIESYEETFATIVAGFQKVYGSSINVDSNSPDGQALGIYAQAKQDMLDLAVQMYNCFDVDKVIGQAQDMLYKLNGVYRKASQFTFVRVNIINDRDITLQGLDSNILNPNGTGYTVSDINGNQFILNSSTTISAGTHTLEFRAQNAGAIEVLPNTINTPVTIILGITGVNNPESQYSLGDDEETDAEFRLRRAKSTAISAQGFDDSLEAQILNLATVTDCKVFDNRKKVTDEYGTAGNTVWTIVEGGTDEEVAQRIYANVTDGCGMRGEIKVPVQKQNGLYEDIFFDRAIIQPLYIKASIRNLSAYPLDEDYIKKQLVDSLFYRIAEPANESAITCLLLGIESGGKPFDVAVSTDGVDYTDYVETLSPQHKFVAHIEDVDLTIVDQVE